MKIVIDARMYNESGIGRYIRNLISELQILDHENEYFILHLKNNFTVTDDAEITLETNPGTVDGNKLKKFI